MNAPFTPFYQGNTHGLHFGEIPDEHWVNYLELIFGEVSERAFVLHECSPDKFFARKIRQMVSNELKRRPMNTDSINRAAADLMRRMTEQHGREPIIPNTITKLSEANLDDDPVREKLAPFLRRFGGVLNGRWESVKEFCSRTGLGVSQIREYSRDMIKRHIKLVEENVREGLDLPARPPRNPQLEPGREVTFSTDQTFTV